MTVSNAFRAPNGVRYLEGLFYEKNRMEARQGCHYTLKDRDHQGFESLYRLYMEMEDLTEWEFANTYLDGWEHWELLTKCTWFKPFAERWRKELELKIRGRALLQIRLEAAIEDAKTQYSANKLLLEAGWKDKETPAQKRGRPSKEEIKKEADYQAESIQRLKTDSKRIKLDA